MREPWRTALVGGLVLIVGFAVAQGTGIRWLGGIVLIAGAAWCGRRWWAACGPVRALSAVLAFGLGFVLSHPLGHVIGAWPSVLAVAVACSLAAAALTRPRRSVPSPNGEAARG